MTSEPKSEEKRVPKLRVDYVNQLAAKSDDTTSNTTVSNSSLKPKSISDSAWQRFQALQKRADTVTKRTTEKRIKVLKQNLLEKVQSELTNEEDKEILREHDVKFGPPVRNKDRQSVSEEKKEENERQSSADTEAWQEVKQHLNINKHLEQSTPSTSAPKSGLEVKVNEAIERGDIHTAEVLSDKLSARDFGVKITEAVAARDFLKRKKEEENKVKDRKKKKLNWGFEHKQRWETKGNM